MSTRLLRLEKTTNPQLDPHYSNGHTEIAFDSVVTNELSDFLSVSPDGTTLTALTDTTAHITAGAVWADEGGLLLIDSWRAFIISHNGSSVASTVYTIPDDDACRQEASVTLKLEQGDTVQVVVNNDRTGGATVLPSAMTFFEASVVPASPTGINSLVPAVLAYKTQDQAFQGGTAVALTWDDTSYDPHGLLTSSTEFTIPAWATHAKVTAAQMYLNSGDGNLRQMGVNINGSNPPGSGWIWFDMPDSGNFPQQITTSVFPVNENDVIQIMSRHNTSVTKTVVGNADQTWAQIELVPAV